MSESTKLRKMYILYQRTIFQIPFLCKLCIFCKNADLISVQFLCSSTVYGSIQLGQMEAKNEKSVRLHNQFSVWLRTHFYVPCILHLLILIRIISNSAGTNCETSYKLKQFLSTKMSLKR